MTTNHTALFIDGENLRHFIESVLKKKRYPQHTISILNVDFDRMFNLALKDLLVTTKIYYSAKLKVTQDTLATSEILIERQRVLKTRLEKQGYQYLIAGTVRPQQANKKSKVVFKEKGVDVRLAIDLLVTAVDKTYSTVVLCSSDSDLQPAIKVARERGLKVIYLGFESQPNKGLTYTTDQTILLKSSEIIASLDKSIKLQLPSLAHSPHSKKSPHRPRRS